MLERPPALVKLLPMLTESGRLAEALRGAWAPLAKGLGERLGLDKRDLEPHRQATLGQLVDATNYAFCLSHAVNSLTLSTAARDGRVANKWAGCAP